MPRRFPFSLLSGFIAAAFAGGALLGSCGGGNLASIDSSTYLAPLLSEFVLGQSSLTAAVTPNGPTAQTLKNPRGVAVSAGVMAVVDGDYNRVLVWTRLPDADDSSPDPADTVVGQPDFVSGSANQGGSANASTLNNPMGVALSEGARFLIVYDNGNNRILIWDWRTGIPQGAAGPASLVVGQSDFTSTSQNHGLGASCDEYGIAGGGGTVLGNVSVATHDGVEKLLVADANNNRVLIWNSIPHVNFAPASIVLGQSNMTSNALNPTSATSMRKPHDAEWDGSRFIVSDRDSGRVLVWNSFPSTGQAADYVLGYHLLTSPTNPGATTQSQIGSQPRLLHSDGTYLYVSDGSANNRIMIWRWSTAASIGAAAAYQWGQPDFTSSLANNGGVSRSSMSFPYGVVSDGTRLIYTDRNNNRVVAVPLSSVLSP